MIEDKLTKDERIRLEALNQANTSLMGRAPSETILLMRAQKLESYIREGMDPDGPS